MVSEWGIPGEAKRAAEKRSQALSVIRGVVLALRRTRITCRCGSPAAIEVGDWDLAAAGSGIYFLIEAGAQGSAPMSGLNNQDICGKAHGSQALVFPSPGKVRG